MNISDEIKRLHELHQAGALSDAEFSQAKARLLAEQEKASLGPGPGNGDLASEFSRLRRTRGDRWISGVCGGLARVSGMDSWVWRLVFTVFTLYFLLGLLIYLLMWVFVPEE
ncbi:PspC domain-containing protein [Massilia atriviolacea]|uniref:PspC domain-containing protein n=1 Tax=Massilia atriviolacea TaxID=2495579 RepID=A0A430HNC3_9BURK|nr:PspC domain-containing protein [Massilia atriviolacea]RSZ59056.1 PspC domain-containing protein [Massilia atriviolacea]